MRVEGLREGGFWGGKLLFCGAEPWNGKLFHVEQFEIGRNDVGFRCFWTVKKRYGTVGFTVLRTVVYGGILPCSDGESSQLLVY